MPKDLFEQNNISPPTDLFEKMNIPPPEKPKTFRGEAKEYAKRAWEGVQQIVQPTQQAFQRTMEARGTMQPMKSPLTETPRLFRPNIWGQEPQRVPETALPEPQQYPAWIPETPKLPPVSAGEMQQLRGTPALVPTYKPTPEELQSFRQNIQPTTLPELGEGVREAGKALASGIAGFIPSIGTGVYSAIKDLVTEGKVNWQDVEKAQNRIAEKIGYTPTTKTGEVIAQIATLPYSYPREGIVSLGRDENEQKTLGMVYDVAMATLLAKGTYKGIKKGIETGEERVLPEVKPVSQTIAEEVKKPITIDLLAQKRKKVIEQTMGKEKAITTPLPLDILKSKKERMAKGEEQVRKVIETEKAFKPIEEEAQQKLTKEAKQFAETKKPQEVITPPPSPTPGVSFASYEEAIQSVKYKGLTEKDVVINEGADKRWTVEPVKEEVKPETFESKVKKWMDYDNSKPVATAITKIEEAGLLEKVEGHSKPGGLFPFSVRVKDPTTGKIKFLTNATSVKDFANKLTERKIVGEKQVEMPEGKPKIGDDVEFLTEGGKAKGTGIVHSIFEGKVYVIPDGAKNPIPIDRVTKIIPFEKLTKEKIKVEPYDFTQKEYIKRIGTTTGLTIEQVKQAHKQYIQQALSEGKPVSKEVLAEYPDLQSTKTMPKVTMKGVEAELSDKINKTIGEVTPPAGLSIKKTGIEPTKKITEEFKFENEQTESRWKSSYGVRKEPLVERGKEILNTLWNKMSRGVYEHLPRTKEYSQLRTDLLRLAKQKGVATDRSLRNIQGITLNFSKADRNIFDRKVILEDLASTVEKGKEVPFGFDKPSITKELNRINAEVTKYPHIQQALETREKVWTVLKDEYRNSMKSIGYDVSEKLSNENYFRHQVLDYVKAKGLYGVGKKLKTPTYRGFLKERKGSELDINTDYIQAEHEVMSQMMYDIEVAKTIKMIDDRYSITKDIKKQLAQDKLGDEALATMGLDEISTSVGKDWHDLIPKGYTTWQPREGNVFYMADTIPAKLANKLTEGLVEEIGITADDLGKALSVGQRRREFVVKEEVAQTLDNLTRNKDVSRVINVDRKALKAWKVWQLISPRRFVKYNVRNLTGDADGVFLGNPSGFKKTPQAFRELYEVFYGDKSMPPEMKEWFERGGMETTLQAQEMGQINKLNIFLKQYETQKAIKDIPLKVWQRYWKNARLATDFREAVLRYANHLDFLEQMNSNPEGLPKSFGASLREEILGLSDKRDRAFKMSNELLGAYDDISVMGQALREHLFPFWSWKEINFKRYYRLYKNAVYEGNVSQKAGRHALKGLATSPYKAYKIGKFMLKASAFWAGLQAYNNLFFPKEEAELDEKTRARPHIILGRSKEGKIQLFSRIGALGDFLEWFGLDAAPQYVDKWFKDKMSLNEIAKDMAKSPANVIVQSATPYFKTPAELLAQRKFFPDFTKPVRIRDNGLYIAESLGLGSEYRALTKLPSKPYSKSLPHLFYYEVDPGEAAYSNIYEEKQRFLKKIGKGGEGFWKSPRGDALYNLRLALRYKDQKAANEYFLEYLRYGGTSEGLVTSLRNMSPIAGLSEDEKTVFVNQLDEEGKQNLLKAVQFYNNVLLQLTDKEQSLTLENP